MSSLNVVAQPADQAAFDDTKPVPAVLTLDATASDTSSTEQNSPGSGSEHALTNKAGTDKSTEHGDIEAQVMQLEPGQPEKKSKGFWFVLLSLMLAMFLATLDATVVSTATPTIARDLNAVSEISWVANGYLLPCTALFPIWGKISSIFGHRETMLFCIATFFVASIICAMAPSIIVFIIGRALQGVGGGAIEALVAIIIAELVTPAERPKYQSLTGAVFGLSSILGPLLGGVFTDAVSWRWIFWINLPISALAFAGIFFYLRIPRPGTTMLEKLQHIDYLGVVTVLIGNVGILLACTWGGNEYAWSSPAVISSFVIGGVFWAVFILVEFKVAKDPILPPRLFTIRNNIFANITNFAQGWITLGFVYYMPIWWQAVQGVPALKSGVYFIPAFLSTVFTVISSGIAVEKIGRAREFIIVGMAGLTFGCAIFGFLAKADWAYWIVALIGVQLGMSLGLTLATLLITIQNSSGPEELGPATSLAFFGRNLGGIFSITVVSAVVANTLPGILEPKLAPYAALGLPADVITTLAKQGAGGDMAKYLSAIPGDVAQAIITAVQESLNQAIKNGYISMVPIAAIGLITSICIKHEPFKREEAQVHLEQ